MMRVEAPLRIWTPGQSTSVSTSGAPAEALASVAVAFDDDLNRSSGDVLKKLLAPPVLPQPASASAAMIASKAPARPAYRFRSPPISCAGFCLRPQTRPDSKSTAA